MTETVETENVEKPEWQIAEEARRDAINAALTLSADDFATCKALDRDRILFVLLQETLANQLTIVAKIREYEGKVRELGAPGGIEKLIGSFMGSDMAKGLPGGMGGLGALMGGKGLFG